MQADRLFHYFPGLKENQRASLEALQELYSFWNTQINVISRKDMDQFYLHHVLHSLSIAYSGNLEQAKRVLDIGTGGGFPGIPLAILYPDTEFVLIDSIGKKIKVVKAIAESLGLKNVSTIHSRAEDVKIKSSFIVSRAVTRLLPFLEFTQHLWEQTPTKSPSEGLYYLKGGDLMEELAETGILPEVRWINQFFEEDFFATKAIVFIQKDKLTN